MDPTDDADARKVRRIDRALRRFYRDDYPTAEDCRRAVDLVVRRQALQFDALARVVRAQQQELEALRGLLAWQGVGLQITSKAVGLAHATLAHAGIPELPPETAAASYDGWPVVPPGATIPGE